MFLADLSMEELFREIARDEFPKWSSMCLLRAVGAPTLEAFLIEPNPAGLLHKMLRDAVQYFGERTHVDRVMLRTDRRRETKSYLRGGNSYTLDKAVEVAVTVVEIGRTVIVLEPTDRLTNQVAINIAVEPDGRSHAELLGPGFDASNLQRGDVTPEYIVSGLPLDKMRVSSPTEHQICVSRMDSVSMGERIASRLAGLIEHILPTYGADFRNRHNALQLATDWMRTNGYAHLFRDKFFPFPSQAFARAFKIAQLIYQFRLQQRRFSSFVLSSSVLSRSRTVFWDVTDGQRKWGSG